MKKTLGILLGTLLLFGQQPPTLPPPNPDRGGTVFSVTSTLVQVDAVVTDGKGHNIADLTPADFEVLIDGKAQPLTHFSYVRVAAETQAAEPRPAVKTGPALPPPSAQLRPEDVRHTLVLMVDDLGLSFPSMAFVRRSLSKFVENQMQPGDLVAVLRTGAGSGALQQFTADKRVLLSIIDGLRWNPNGRAGIDVFDQAGKYSALAERLGGASSSGGISSLDVRYEILNKTISTVGTLGSLSYIVDALREMPGRKSIILFSDGIQLFNPGIGPAMHRGGAGATPIENDVQVTEALRKLIDRANRAGTVIYTMQATGLQPRQLDATDRVTSRAQADLLTHVGAIGGRDWYFNIMQQGLAYLADKTGGLAYENGNDLNWGLDRMLEDQKGYYLLGFHPPEGLLQEKHRALNFHGISVKVKRAGLHVRSRSGFFGQTDEEMQPSQPRTPIEQIRAAMLSPFKSSGIRLRLTALYAETPKRPVVRNLLHIDARDLTWRSNPDGSATAQLQLLAVATGDGDVPLQAVAPSYDLKVLPAKMEQTLRDGVVYTLDVPAPKRGGYQIRAAVRDRASARVGSASQFVEVPDLNKAPFVLASIILDDGIVSGGKPGFLGVPAAFGITPARRQFRPGGELEYFCAVQKGRDPQSRKDLATRIRIVHEGQEVYSAAAQVVDVAGSGPAVFGVLRLTNAMPPGEYYLQVVAMSRGGGKNAVEYQWTDFKVTQ
jgi:VWFA-related protein